MHSGPPPSRGLTQRRLDVPDGIRGVCSGSQYQTTVLGYTYLFRIRWNRIHFWIARIDAVSATMDAATAAGTGLSAGAAMSDYSESALWSRRVKRS